MDDFTKKCGEEAARIFCGFDGNYSNHGFPSKSDLI